MHQSLALGGFFRICATAAALAAALHVASPDDVLAAPVAMTGRLAAFQPGSAPQGFHGICTRYPWACENRGSGPAGPAALQLAAQVNARVNQQIRGTTDAANHGVPERWTLPYNGKGDCEDYALLKMKLLIDSGVPASNLLLAVVAGPMPEPHVVLVLRADAGDYILDNVSSRIKTWQRSRYTFLKMQNPANRAKWNIILLGPRAVRS